MSDAARLADTTEDAYLLQIGARVRAWRDMQSITRKSLALRSGLSERYLALLEAGEGNLSISLLRQLARAMKVPLTDLVREGADGAEREATLELVQRLPHTKLREARRLLQPLLAANTPQRIALIGLRGAGKSTLGAALAKALSVEFVELDRRVEQEAGASLAQIFSLYGQDGYRRFEQRALQRLIDQQNAVVLAVGGSVVSEPHTYEMLRAAFTTVWLKARPEQHMSRVVAQGDLRPMQGRAEAMQELRRILAEREPLYAQADHQIDTSAQSERQSLAALKRCVSLPIKEKVADDSI